MKNCAQDTERRQDKLTQLQTKTENKRKKILEAK